MAVSKARFLSAAGPAVSVVAFFRLCHSLLPFLFRGVVQRIGDSPDLGALAFHHPVNATDRTVFITSQNLPPDRAVLLHGLPVSFNQLGIIHLYTNVASPTASTARVARHAVTNPAYTTIDGVKVASIAQAAVESAESRLAMLHDEYAEVQRNPSANSAAYSVRADELQTEISDAAHELQSARDDLPRITQELEDALAHARKAVSEAEKPMDDAKQAFREVSSAADEARNTYREAKDDATERQRKLKEEISGKEKERRAQEQAAEDAREEASEAQALIDEANDIHAHPEVTETIAARLEADRAEREEQAVEVEQLASTEKAVRERTRGSRARFIGAIVGIVVLVVAVFALVIVFMNR